MNQALALEDGVVLAQHLRDTTDLAKALETSETARRPRVERAAEQGRRSGSGKAAGPIERVLRDRIFLPLAQRRYNKNGAHDSDRL